MNPDIHLVIALQSLDGRIADLDKKIAALPKHVAEIEKALDSHQRRLEADRAALTANQKERKTREGDIQVQEQKIAKLRDQTLQAKTNEQYRAFETEVEFCQKEIRRAEDRILELMTESEPLAAAVLKAASALQEETDEVEAEKKKAQQHAATDEKVRQGLVAERAEMAKQVPPGLLKLYDRVRKKWHGQALAEVVDGQCGRCYIRLRPQMCQDLRAGVDIQRCDSCGRILYYVPPVDVEKTMATERVANGSRVDMS